MQIYENQGNYLIGPQSMHNTPQESRVNTSWHLERLLVHELPSFIYFILQSENQTTHLCSVVRKTRRKIKHGEKSYAR
jgi:hypothetical protein